MDIQNLTIYILAAWRIASLFVNERGPFDVFVRIRSLSGIGMDENGYAIEIPDTFFAQVLSCVWCFSIWVAFFMTAFWLLSSEWSLLFSVPFALSGGAVLIDSVIKRKVS